MNRRWKNLFSSVCYLAGPLFVVLVVERITKHHPRALPSHEDIPVDLKYQIDVLIGHISAVSAWSLAAMGALSALGVKMIDLGRWNLPTRRVLFVGFGLLVASLYAGHESRLDVVNAYLGAGFADYRSVYIETMTWLQVIGLLAGCTAFPIILGLQSVQPPPAIMEEAESP